jgi:hypothetical protein
MTPDAFAKAIKSVPAYIVTRTLNKFTPGTNWNGCGKHDMLEAVKRANSPNACG